MNDTITNSIAKNSVVLDLTEYMELVKEVELLRKTKLCIVGVMAEEWNISPRHDKYMPNFRVVKDVDSPEELQDVVSKVIEAQLPPIEKIVEKFNLSQKELLEAKKRVIELESDDFVSDILKERKKLLSEVKSKEEEISSLEKSNKKLQERLNKILR